MLSIGVLVLVLAGVPAAILLSLQAADTGAKTIEVTAKETRRLCTARGCVYEVLFERRGRQRRLTFSEAEGLDAGASLQVVERCSGPTRCKYWMPGDPPVPYQDQQ